MTIRPHAPIPKWNPNRSAVVVDPRVILLCVVILALVLAVLTSTIPLSVGVLLSLAMSLFIAFGFVSRQRRFRSFEKEFARAIQRSPDEAADVYSRAWSVRLFSPRAVLLPKVGLVELERGHAARAESYFEQAWLAMPREHRSRLLGPLVRVKAQLGRWSDVLVLAQDWAGSSMTPSNAKVYLAAALLETGEGRGSAHERARQEIADIDGGLSNAARALLEQVQARVGRAKSE